MRRGTFVGLGLGLAITAGFIGRWTGMMQPQSFGQETKRAQANPTDEAMETDRGWIGLMVEKSQAGPLQVSNVFPAGPSAFATIRQGDVVLQVADKEVQSEGQFAKAIEQLKPGEEAVFMVQRGKQKLSFKVTVGSLKEFHGRYAQEMLRRDPRDPNYAKFHGVSPADMSTEMFRRLFEQNQRLETSLLELRKEVAALRSELKEKKPAGR